MNRKIPIYKWNRSPLTRPHPASTALIGLIAVFALLSAFSVASAVTLQIDGTGQLTGATDVVVVGFPDPFDVTFTDGTCIAIFSGCDDINDFAFTSLGTANSAAQALLDSVFLDGPSGAFDSDPSLTLGCISTLNCTAVIPFPLHPEHFNVHVHTTGGRNRGGVFVDGGILLFNPSPLLDLSLNASFVYANWTPTPTLPVPMPGTLILMGTGLAGLFGFRKRIRKDGST